MKKYLLSLFTLFFPLAVFAEAAFTPPGPFGYDMWSPGQYASNTVEVTNTTTTKKNLGLKATPAAEIINPPAVADDGSWDVEYQGILLPELSLPAWSLDGTFATKETYDGQLRLIGNTTDYGVYGIYGQSFNSSQGWRVQARVQAVFSPNQYSTYIGVSDGTHWVGLQILEDRVRLDPNGIREKEEVAYFLDTSRYHTYGLAKKGNKVYLEVDGSLRGKGTAYNTSTSNFVEFGIGDAVVAESYWDYVNWQYGNVNYTEAAEPSKTALADEITITAVSDKKKVAEHSLQYFYNKGVVKIDTLAPGQSKTYDLESVLNPYLSEKFQGLSESFELSLSLYDEPKVTPPATVTPPESTAVNPPRALASVVRANTTTTTDSVGTPASGEAPEVAGAETNIDESDVKGVADDTTKTDVIAGEEAPVFWYGIILTLIGMLILVFIFFWQRSRKIH